MLKIKKRFPIKALSGIGASTLLIGSLVITGVIGISTPPRVTDNDIAIPYKNEQRSPRISANSNINKHYENERESRDSNEAQDARRTASTSPDSTHTSYSSGTSSIHPPSSAIDRATPLTGTATSNVTPPLGSTLPTPVNKEPASEKAPPSDDSHTTTSTPSEENNTSTTQTTQTSSRCSGLNLLGLLCIQ